MSQRLDTFEIEGFRPVTQGHGSLACEPQFALAA
jgi:hypothetical protein